SVGAKYPMTKHAGDDDCTDLGLGFWFQGDLVYPEYLTDPAVQPCPSDAEGNADDFHCNDDPTQPYCPCDFGEGDYVYTAFAIATQLYVTAGADPNAAGGASLNPPFLVTLGTLDAQIGGAADRNAAGIAAEKDSISVAGVGDVLRMREG